MRVDEIRKVGVHDQDDAMNPEIKMDLGAYIKSLGEHLLCEPVYNRDALDEALSTITGDIQDIRQNFNRQAPPGLESVQTFMLESLNLYMQSIDDMRNYMSSEDRDLLEQALVKAEEAEDIVVALEEVIQDRKDWLSQMTEV
jgi:hypothetical protein